MDCVRTGDPRCEGLLHPTCDSTRTRSPSRSLEGTCSPPARRNVLGSKGTKHEPCCHNRVMMTSPNLAVRSEISHLGKFPSSR